MKTTYSICENNLALFLDFIIKISYT